ncbi:hypothetical protein C2G38_2108753 [Gigaspora rosea]|uniref:MD-2-related lipid-recognition domain-containing protein n=1 Tax=Gigaspora rosea TaxID=44941 RepID=A0A397UPP5_9GLOM|nr:hypothetical protein C2G38_2108753 [Gigaspora rosea]
MKNFIFASILLALLLTVNAAPFQLNKRATTFIPCHFDEPVDFIGVKIGTDPPESGKNESFDYFDEKTGNQLGESYNQTFTDSIKAGNPFNISASDVPTPQLPDSYILGVFVGDPSEKTPFGCATAVVGKSSE